MPLLFAVIIVMLVNFSSVVLAQETTTKLRGPRSTDTLPVPPVIGPLAPSDTLWRVAERIRPQPDISLYQVMYALYLKNPDAFLESNLNHLRPGAVLKLPTVTEMRQVDINLARQKSEQDDLRWAARQKVAVEETSQTSMGAIASTKTAQSNAPQQWQTELQQLSEQQRQELDGLRSQFADSMQLVETIVSENLQLKTNLAKVQHDLELLKAQLGEDSEIQQQLQQLLQQQQQLLQERAAQQAAEEAGFNWAEWLSHPLMWIVAACIPALLILSGVLFWVKRRSQHTEQVVNAATTEPMANPAYQSPLPPLDDSNDVDESLFEIDDALLEDAFVDKAADNGQELKDDLLGFDDALSFDDDDSLLPADTTPISAVADPDDDTLSDDFDPENILSDDDLSALLAAADDDDDVIELADDTLPSDEFSDGTDSDDDLLPEPVDNELPADLVDDDLLAESADKNLTEQTAAEVAAEPDIVLDDDQFDIDELIEEIDLDEPDVELPPELTQAEQLSAALSKADDAAETPIVPTQQQEQDELPDDVVVQTDTVAADDQPISPDRSELDEFAESLVADFTEAGQADANTDDNALLSAELSELLDQADDLIPPKESAEPSELESQFAVDSPDMLPEDDDILLMDDASGADADSDSLSALDLASSDDDSVQRPGDAALSVENPSKILEQYPELELTDEDLLSSTLEDDLLDEFSADDVNSDDSEHVAELELDPVPDAQFDTLMSELEAMADNIEQVEQQDNGAEQANEELLAELDENVEPGHNFDDDDFVEIDSLLASAGSAEEDTQRFNQLNVDVGLDDYADIIGEHEQRDVDIEDNGYSAKLDLVRAYIEIDDIDSAELILDEILASDAPEHIKTEAQRLKA